MTRHDETIDWSRLASLREEIGPEEFAAVIEVFLADTDALVADLPKTSLDRLEAALHAIKGSALNLGLAQLAALCAEGEVRAAVGRPKDVALAPILLAYGEARRELVRGLSEAAADGTAPQVRR
jgi:HPt (histidine-containing phosphotransfer) domain-containing protein